MRRMGITVSRVMRFRVWRLVGEGRRGAFPQQSESFPVDACLRSSEADGILDSFNLGLTAVGSSSCVGALVGQDLGLGSNVWLLGDR